MKKLKIILGIYIFLMISLITTQIFAVTEKDNGILKIYNANSQRYGLAFDIEGYSNGKLIQTTWGNNEKESGMSGYMTYMKVDNNAAQKYTTYTGNMTQSINGVDLKVDADFANDGKYAKIIYTVTNKNSNDSKISLGTCADVQIGDNDKATVERLTDNKGLKMYSSTENLQFNFYGKSVQGVTNIDNLWIGKWEDNWYREDGYIEKNVVFANNTNTKIENTDSSFSYSWVDRTIKAGSTQTFSVLIGVGQINYSPELEVTTQNNANINVNLVKITGKIKDQDANDTVNLYYSIDNGKEVKDSKTYSPKGTSENFELDLTSNNLSLGNHVIKLWAIDSEGNPSDVITRNITIVKENEKNNNTITNTNTNNNTITNTNNNLKDNTVAKNEIPKTGKDVDLIGIILLVIIIGIAGAAKYFGYKDVK